MKRHIVILAVIAITSLGLLAGQASASFIHIVEYGEIQGGEASEPAPVVHVVESGDTLWAIARDNDVSVDELLAWNELDSTLIYPDQELKIEIVIENEAEVESYVVVKGDTLFEIAESHNISLQELMQWNLITSDLIFPGDELALSETKQSSSRTTVEAPPKKEEIPELVATRATNSKFIRTRDCAKLTYNKRNVGNSDCVYCLLQRMFWHNVYRNRFTFKSKSKSYRSRPFSHSARFTCMGGRLR